MGSSFPIWGCVWMRKRNGQSILGRGDGLWKSWDLWEWNVFSTTAAQTTQWGGRRWRQRGGQGPGQVGPHKPGSVVRIPCGPLLPRIRCSYTFFCMCCYETYNSMKTSTLTTTSWARELCHSSCITNFRSSIIPFYRLGHGGSNRLNNFPKGKWLGGNRAEFRFT